MHPFCVCPVNGLSNEVMYLFSLIRSLQSLIFYMDDQRLVANLDYFLVMSFFVTLSQLTILSGFSYYIDAIKFLFLTY